MTSANLVRVLGFGSSLSLVIGSVIGTGVFLVAADITQKLGSPWVALSVWPVAGLISWMGGLVHAELGARYPQAGGVYVFLREAFGEFWGFLFGWTLVLVIQTGSIAAVGAGFSLFLDKLLNLGPTGQKISTSLIVILLTALNCFGVKKAARFLDWTTILRVVSLIGFVLFCSFWPSIAPKGSLVSFGSASPGWSWAGYGVALIAAFWAYDGWNNITYVAGEIENPQKNIPKALGLGVILIGVLYALVNFFYFTVLSTDEIAKSAFVAGEVVERLGGRPALLVLEVLVVLSAMGCLQGLILCGARVTYAMSKDKVFLPGLDFINPKTHTPNRALIFQGAWTLLLVWSGTYDQLFTYVIFAAFVFYGLTAAAMIKIRTQSRKSGQSSYLVPGYPWIPIAYLVFTLGFALNAVNEKPKESASGLGIICLGAVVYLLRSRFRR